MQTINEWAIKVTNNEELFIDWLKKQYIGEVTAVSRIKELILDKTDNIVTKQFITSIINDEAQHALWIKELIKNRNIELPKINKEDAESKYWSVLKELNNKEFTFEEYCAFAHHAEAMRLKRITHITLNPKFPPDVRNIFNLILADEQFHSRTFAILAGDFALNNVSALHEKGKELIGLIDD